MSNMYKRTKNDPRLTKGRKGLKGGFFSKIGAFFFRRGTNPWKVNLTKKSIPWARILAPVLIATIPFTVLLTVDNAVMRLPDLYAYHFLSSEILSERMVAADEDAVAQLISDYVLHKTDKFQMKEDLEYMPADLFTKEDGAMMESLRSLLDWQAVAGLCTLLVSILLIVYIIRKKEKDLLLQSFYYSLPVFLGIKIIDAALVMFGPLRTRVFGIPAVSESGDVNLIPALLDGSFFRLLAGVETLLSIVVLGLVYYIILNLAGRKTTFRR